MAKDRFAPKPLNDVVGKLPGRLQSYAKASQKLEHYQTLLNQAIGGPLANKCHVSNYQDQILVISADSAAVAMRLNYMKLAIASELRKSGLAELSSIKVQTNPAKQTVANEAIKKSQSQGRSPGRVMSKQTADNLLELAQHAPESLKQKLQKLAKHGK